MVALMKFRVGLRRKRFGLAVGVGVLLLASSSGVAQKKPASDSPAPQMIMTGGGFLAVQTPKGWMRAEGPGLAFFVREGDNPESAKVWIYISAAAIGPQEKDKDVEGYIRSDIEGFKQRFKKADVQRIEPIDLPERKMKVPTVAFKSGESHNSFEQVAYVDDGNRVLTFTVSAKNDASYEKAKAEFYHLVRSYRGSIQMGSGEPSVK
jgi:hypothetical protein